MTALIRVVYSREVQQDLPGWGRAVGRVWHVCESDHSSRAVSESRLRTGRPDRGRSTPPARARNQDRKCVRNPVPQNNWRLPYPFGSSHHMVFICIHV